MKPIPQNVKFVVRRRARGCCEECGREGMQLEFHHLRYYRYKREPIFGYETADDLAYLCRDCHLERHVFMGEFYQDPEERDAEADYYDHMTSKDD